MGNHFKKSKLAIVVLSILTVSLLFGCDSSKALNGEWKVQGEDLSIYTLKFTEKTLEFNGDKVDIKQVGAGFENGYSYLSFEAEGTLYCIYFPDKKDKKIAIMIEPDDEDHLTEGIYIFAMNRKDNPSYWEYAEQYLDNVESAE